MIITNTPANEAILSNVQTVDSFTIEANAKAFIILSSGLYSNKIRAIIRELSCNAIDSHVAAKTDVPYDVHLPTDLSPWFSIRDYGTGLTHDEVMNVYKTYFKSTKTGSNEFIGALGLGSKSPFSYTDNFSVISIKNGWKGIYSAFINEEGKPSIALMAEESTDEHPGLEVKFSVEDYYDFQKFASEASEVYQYFDVKPNFTNKNIAIPVRTYDKRDIIPGVHQSTYNHYSIAIMGNIPYPIDVPNEDINLGDVKWLLECGLELHFDIGEIEFQPSREGLSYIPKTIKAIKGKLEALRDELDNILTAEVSAIDNPWKLALTLERKSKNKLWLASVKKYIADNKLEHLLDGYGYGVRVRKFELNVATIAKDYNISLAGAYRVSWGDTYQTIRPQRSYNNHSSTSSIETFNFMLENDVIFVENDTKLGGMERAKYHHRHAEVLDIFGVKTNSHTLIVMSRVDKNQPMKVAEFLKELYNPPLHVLLSTLTEKPKRASSVSGQNVSIMKLVKNQNGYYRRKSSLTWSNTVSLSSFDSTKTYYYLPLKGYDLISEYGHADPKVFQTWIDHLGLDLGVDGIYGIRKGDLDNVKQLKNWVNLEEHIKQKLSKIDAKMTSGVARTLFEAHQYGDSQMLSKTLLEKIVGTKFHDKMTTLFTAPAAELNSSILNTLLSRYKIASTSNPMADARKILDDAVDFVKKYPMLQAANFYKTDLIADYIKFMETVNP